MRMRLSVDIVECDLTGELVDYVLVDEQGNVIARLGPEGASEKEKIGLLDDLGLKSAWGYCKSHSGRVVLEVES